MAIYTVSYERSNGTKVAYADFRPAKMFEGLSVWSVQIPTSDQLLMVTASGDRLLVKGNNLSIDKNAIDPWVGGTITSVEFWASDLSVKYVSITGLDTPLAEFGHALPNGDAALSVLLSERDTLIGGDGNDINLAGFGGNDSIFGGNGDDDILPGAGNDTIDGGAGSNGVGYWDFNDPSSQTGVEIDLSASAVLSVTDPWGFTDTLINIQNLYGSGGNDKLTGNDAANWLGGANGDDNLRGGAGDDFLEPGRGHDTISGGIGSDMVTYEKFGRSIKVDLHLGTVDKGPDGTDTISEIEIIRATSFHDSINGSAADETFQTLAGNDSVDGGAGRDTVNYNRDFRTGGASGVTVNLAAGTATDGFGDNDVLLNIENVSGTQSADRITGDDGANLIIGREGDDNLAGGAGDDTLEGGAGGDILRGGAGEDTAIFSGAKAAYSFTAGANGMLIVSGAETDLVYETELFKFDDGTFALSQLLAQDPVVTPPSQPPVVTPPVTVEVTASTILSEGSLNLTAGGSGNISLTGNALNNSVTGNKGKNAIDGGAGDDRVNGGLGNDILTGGSGKDAFLFNTKLGTSKTDRKVNFDTLKDFSGKDDSIQLDNAIFKKIGKKGSGASPAKLDKKFFIVGDKAKDKDDYIVYNKKTGVLSYDADGSGKGQAVEFALLKNKATLKVGDFFVI